MSKMSQHCWLSKTASRIGVGNNAPVNMALTNFLLYIQRTHFSKDNVEDEPTLLAFKNSITHWSGK